MTEAEWLTSTDPTPILEYLRGKASDRKLRLFAVACCRRIWHFPLELMDSEGSSWIRSIRDAVGIGERLADGQATASELEKVKHLDGNGVEVFYAFIGCCDQADDLLPQVAENAIWAVGEYAFTDTPLSVATAEQAEKSAQCDILRDIIGNPFNPVTIEPAWLTPTVTGLATAAYEERHLPSGTLDNDRLRVLSDALEEAGCHDSDILDHCRQPEQHVRGCWVVDLLLGKE